MSVSESLLLLLLLLEYSLCDPIAWVGHDI